MYFGTSSPPPYITNVSKSSYNPGTLNPGTKYYWKIVAKNSCGSTPGPEWNFTTAPTGANITFLKGSGTDYQLRVYTAPTSIGQRGTLIGTDYWTCDGNTVAVTKVK